MTEASLNKREQPPIRVLLVDDHEHVLWGLSKLIEGETPRMTVTGTARTMAQALAAVDEKRPDVVVLDLFLGRENSLDQLPALGASGAGGQESAQGLATRDGPAGPRTPTGTARGKDVSLKYI